MDSRIFVEARLLPSRMKSTSSRISRRLGGSLALPELVPLPTLRAGREPGRSGLAAPPRPSGPAPRRPPIGPRGRALAEKRTWRGVERRHGPPELAARDLRLDRSAGVERIDHFRLEVGLRGEDQFLAGNVPFGGVRQLGVDLLADQLDARQLVESHDAAARTCRSAGPSRTAQPRRMTADTSQPERISKRISSGPSPASAAFRARWTRFVPRRTVPSAIGPTRHAEPRLTSSTSSRSTNRRRANCTRRTARSCLWAALGVAGQGPPFHAAELGEELRHRARVEPRAEQADHRLAVLADDGRLQVPAPIGRVEPPVLLELPDEEAEDAGDAPDDRAHDGHTVA